jgi:hypothetical protein
MKAVVRLVYSYFTCTPALRAFSAAGLAIVFVSLFVVTWLPQSDATLTFAFVGMIAFCIGSSLMPLMFGRLACSHAIRVLPWGRVKLLLSAYITIALVAALAPILVYFAYKAAVLGAPVIPGRAADPATVARVHHDNMQLVWITYASAMAIVSWLYLAMWFITSQRNTIGFVKGLLVILILLLAPVREISQLDANLRWSLIRLGALWLVFGVGFMLWPRWQVSSARRALSRVTGAGRALSRKISGREIDLMLGTANPWLLIAAQVAPIVIATRIGYYSAAVWLYYLTIFSTVAGAIAGQAAERSRALWLRGDWSRAELFPEVERSFWRHNGFVLGALLALMVAIGSYANLPVALLAAGLPLLALGTVLSTYLGLMITRGLGWLEAGLAIVVMVALMAVAVLAARQNASMVPVVALEALLAGLAVALRTVARRRWTAIDWTRCRPDRALAARAA